MLIHHFLENSANLYPDKVALIHEKTRATYKEINQKANNLANWLITNGIQKGDRVIILLENSLEYVVSYYGILKAGAVTVPLSTGLKPDGLIPLVEELEPKVIISSTKFERLLKAANLNIPGLDIAIISKPKLLTDSNGYKVVSFEDLISTNSKGEPNNPESLPREIHDSVSETDFTGADILINENDLSSIIYTSGSTGKPKGVMLSHKNIVSNTNSICESLKLRNSDIQMVVLPFFYVMGKSLLNTLFAVGGTIVINNKFAYPATVINQMIDEKVTLFSGVPSTYAYLLHRSPLATHNHQPSTLDQHTTHNTQHTNPKNQLSHLRLVTQAGGHMAKSVKIALKEALPEHTKIFIMYGATEASARLTCLDPDFFNEKIDSIGKPIPEVVIRLLDEKGNQVQRGTKGEVVANGANIMMGYWKDPESTGKVLDEKGYHTGDIGRVDEDGFIFLEGRKDNLIKMGGHRINPREIEDVIIASNLVVETIVIATKDKLLGKKLIALVVSKDVDLDKNLILSICLKDLPKYKLPSDILFVRSLPKNSSGKVDRKQCQKMIKSTSE